MLPSLCSRADFGNGTSQLPYGKFTFIVQGPPAAFPARLLRICPWVTIMSLKKDRTVKKVTPWGDIFNSIHLQNTAKSMPLLNDEHVNVHKYWLATNLDGTKPFRNCDVSCVRLRFLISHRI